MYELLVELVRSFPQKPGVYRMYSETNDLLYVGKAKNLYKRVRSYFSGHKSPRTEAMLSHVCSIEITVTSSEEEALLLESNLIKSLSPRYNIVFKDGKTYPYLKISAHKFPRISFYRGTPQVSDQLYGPYPNAQVVKKTIALIQKIFLLRTCNDHTFSSVKRPCLLYQMKRCTAPCVSMVSQNDYSDQCQKAKLFLSGKDKLLKSELKKKMIAFADDLAYEKADEVRLLIEAIEAIRSEQHVVVDNKDRSDVMSVHVRDFCACVSVVEVREGRVVNQYNVMPDQAELLDGDCTIDHVLFAYLSQQSRYRLFSGHLIIPAQCATLIESIRVICPFAYIACPGNTSESAWMRMADHNAALELIRYQDSFGYRFNQMKLYFFPESPPNCSVVCIDISHTQGKSAVAACVYFLNGVFDLKASKRYALGDSFGGDDCAAMKESILRYFSPRAKDQVWPDILLLDGGQQQVDAVYDLLSDGSVMMPFLIGIAKGAGRKVGLESIVYPSVMNRDPLLLGLASPVLLALAHIRDQAHAFAIGRHRQKRDEVSLSTFWTRLPGVGRVRGLRLFEHFGTPNALLLASIDEIAQVKGISASMAHDIYNDLHSGTQ